MIAHILLLICMVILSAVYMLTQGSVHHHSCARPSRAKSSVSSRSKIITQPIVSPTIEQVTLKQPNETPPESLTSILRVKSTPPTPSKRNRVEFADTRVETIYDVKSSEVTKRITVPTNDAI